MAAVLSAVRAPVARWLAGKTRTERFVVMAIVFLVGATLLWVAVWQPLLRDRDALRSAHSGDRVALAAAQKIAEETAGLARTGATPAPADTRAGLERALVAQGLRPAVTQLDWQDDRARVVFAAVGYDALIALLERLQREEKLRVVEATITARVEPGTVRAELALAR